MPTITDIERDEVNVNLTVLAKLPINTRLNTSGVYMNIESETYIPQFVRRWARGDNRDEMIQKINRVVIKAISIISQNPNDIELLTHLNNASTGIMNLKETYSTCVQTCARLDVINNKIKSRNSDNTIDL
jgi:hypothetical protein